MWRKSKGLFYGLVALLAPILLGIFAIHEEYNTYLFPVYLVSLSGLGILFGFVAVNWVQEIFNRLNLRFLWAIFFGLVSIGWLLHTFGLENKNRYTLAEDFGTNVMKGLPRGAILLADGDHYVMSIWYGRYARGLRPDLVFEPSVFLLHGWGWKQLCDQCADLKPLVESSNLFQDRLNALTGSYTHHPLFYSLGRDFLEKGLYKMPGAWVPRGLVYAWEARKPGSLKIMNQALRSISAERQRGLDLEWESPGLDFSSREIYHYYSEQLPLLKQ
jgi:hypothetical protein